MKLGFTGTRYGLTHKQKRKLWNIFCSLELVEEFHFGNCVGADFQAALLVTCLFGQEVVVCHPPTGEAHRQDYTYCGKIFPDKFYLNRNRDIVDASDLLIACPQQKEKQSRGGTWYTIRYAEEQKKDLCVIFPDGKLSENYTPSLVRRKKSC